MSGHNYVYFKKLHWSEAPIYPHIHNRRSQNFIEIEFQNLWNLIDRDQSWAFLCVSDQIKQKA